MSNSIGVVTISEEYDNTDRILELKNEDGSIWESIDLYKTWKGNPEFRILSFKPDYFLFHIKCIDQSSTDFRVVVNEATGLTKTIQKSNKVKLVSWEKFVQDVFSIGLKEESIVYDAIGGKPIPDIPTQKNIIVPKEVKGDWMRIIWSVEEYVRPTDDSESKSGWIRWKKNNKLNIILYHLS
ncbi:hypothetical protein [Roseivirga pacifica]|uniref:hypothetical protein n=1 Tax=Roseivirga pacifica TaxID=1267423 RepID=UPI002094ECA0|nr:hypothetical protein [Roseivirga pacifica]MCO6359132.1 hypothetical protein [Roseivirga pacifica]MCO6365232.1 hypothetical protein [Roseivirga pacifica]MCO6372038.1 hypothetical protein [Roseivirga pacifica]MCO6375851.1 hypothetical protein [Roseivirga pacifica]